MSLWPVWRGGYCYGPRLILPIIPFAFLGIIRVFESLPSRSARFQRGAAAICGLSLGILPRARSCTWRFGTITR